MKEGAICLRDAAKDEGRAPRREQLNLSAEALVYRTHAVDLCKTQKGERYPDTMIIRIAWEDHA